MKKYLLLLLGFATFGLNAQSLTSSENYIYSKTNLSADGTKKVETVTYYDGLGRPKQTIAIKATPSGKDLVTPILYDEFGRQAIEVMPFPMVTKSGGYQGVQSPTAATAYYEDKAYTEKVFENSPLDRVLEQKQTGNNWNGHSVHFFYEANAANEVAKYTTLTTWNNNATVSKLAKSGYYAASALYKNTVTDEDGISTTEFKNGQGQTLLVRKKNGSSNIDTYYVYNEYNQLAFVISPLAADKFKNIANFTYPDTDSNIKNLCYVYRYDGKGRLVEKKLPGKDWEYMVYDKLDRIVMSQDGNMRAASEWLFTKYDVFGRVIYTGTATASSRIAAQAAVGAKSANDEEYSTTGVTFSGLKIYYTNSTAYPTSIKTLLTVNYYDKYPPDIPARPTSIFGQITLPSSNFPTRSLKGLPVASYVKNIEDNGWTKTYTWYDDKGRAIGSHSDNYLGGYTTVHHKLDFSGVVLNTTTYHKRLAADSQMIISEVYTYDNQNRLTKHTHQVNSEPVETLAENTYDETGKLILKKVGNNLQTIDYKYNVKGWLTQINNTAAMGQDIFAMDLRYESPKNPTVAPKRYNGNIAEIDWKTNYSGSDGILRRYGYQYDGLNRLKLATYQEPNLVIPQPNYFNEGLTYDANGNITTLQRFQKPGWGTTAMLIDNLSYTYTGNQVTKIADAANNTNGYPGGGGTITYDANGNMLKIPDKKISDIAYNFLNLPQQITQTSGSTTYVYRADGLKVKKVFGNKTTDYLNGFQYVNSILQFFPTTEGYYDFVKNAYIYNYVDHLGNVRLSYTKKTSGSGAEVLEENNYYPFGLKHEGYNTLAGNPNYQYKYNGKELQETGMYDYGARFYMPDVARWLSIDPLTEKMRRFSPYNYAWNNPIMFVDYDGMFATPPDDYIDASTGKYLGSDGAATKNVRVIYKSDWNNITSDNGGSLSTAATQALQESSSIVTVNNTQINSDINNANNETIADQTKERQVWVGIEVTRGDVPTAQVTSVRGPDGIDGKTTITMDQRGDSSGNIVKQTFGGTKLIPTAQVHTHNTSQDPNLTNIPGTSALDKSTSSSTTGFNIPVYAVDSYTGAQTNGNSIHRVMPNGTETKNVGTTNTNNIGQESLNNFINKQKNP